MMDRQPQIADTFPLAPDLQPPTPDSLAPSPQPSSREELRDVLAIAMRAGQIMLENGANTARVEETIYHIGMALGAETMDVFVTPSGIITTITVGQEHRTRMQRIVRSGVDLSRVAAVLDVSRAAAAGTQDRAAVRQALEQIATQPRAYGPWVTVLAVALACGVTGVLFGAGLREFVAILITAALAHRARDLMMRIQASRPLMMGTVSALATGLALLLTSLLGSSHPAPALMGSVILLVPGLVMISSVVDLFRGDVVSGTARAVSAGLGLVAIAGGMWGVLLLLGQSVVLEPGPFTALALAPFLAIISAGGFGVMFDVPPRTLPLGAMVGGLAYGVFRFAMLGGLPSAAATFLAGIVIGILAEALARRTRYPTSVFSIPGFLPLVPGSLAFRTLIAFVNDDYTGGTANLVRTAVSTVALAAGIGMVMAIARLSKP